MHYLDDKRMPPAKDSVKKYVSEKIDDGDYETKLPYVSRKKDAEANAAYLADCRRLMDEFRADALKDVGLTVHPKRDKVWDKAWADGHAGGLHDVYNELLELAELVK